MCVSNDVLCFLRVRGPVTTAYVLRGEVYRWVKHKWRELLFSIITFHRLVEHFGFGQGNNIHSTLSLVPWRFSSGRHIVMLPLRPRAGRALSAMSANQSIKQSVVVLCTCTRTLHAVSLDVQQTPQRLLSKSNEKYVFL